MHVTCGFTYDSREAASADLHSYRYVNPSCHAAYDPYMDDVRDEDRDPIAELEAIEEARGKLAKAALLPRASALALRLIAASVDPWQVWYVSGPPDCNAPPGDLSGAEASIVFLDVLGMLSTGEHRGNEAQQLLDELWTALALREREWFSRVLRKRLRIGVGATLLNEAHPGSVREFDLPLCDKLEANLTGVAIEWSGKLRPQYPCVADVKIDGLRILGIRRAGDAVWELYTRGGDIVDTMPGARDALARFVPPELGAVVVHGEGYGGSWSSSASSIMAKRRAKEAADGGMPLWLFDIVDLAQFNGSAPATSTLLERRELLDSLFRAAGGDQEHLRSVPCAPISDDAGLLETFNAAIRAGFEGLVVKDPASVPHLGRSRCWLKLKLKSTWEGRVVGKFDGKPGTRLAGTLGGLYVELDNGVVTEVGSGFSDEERDTLADADITGMWAEVEGQPPLTDDGRIRFPVFARFRAATDLG